MNNLAHILDLFGRLTNKKTADAAEREVAIKWINEAAQQIWKLDDLPDSLKPASFNYDGSGMFSFPAYVGLVRGINLGRVPLRVKRGTARFAKLDLRSCSGVTIIGRSALATTSFDLANLSLQFAEPLACPVTVTITGSTAASSSHRVSIDFGVKEVTKLVSSNFIHIESVQKNVVTNANLKLLSGLDELAVVPSNCLESSYIIYEISNSIGVTGSCTAQLLYKPAFVPMFNDADKAQITGSEDAVAYFAAFFSLNTGSADDAAKAARYLATGEQIIKSLNTDDATGKDSPVILGLKSIGLLSRISYAN